MLFQLFNASNSMLELLCFYIWIRLASSMAARPEEGTEGSTKPERKSGHTLATYWTF